MRPSVFLLSTLIFSLASLQVLAVKKHWLQPCNPYRQKLHEGTFQFQTECDAMTYCAANGTCVHRGCRRDEFPFGYRRNVTIPPRCGQGFFCPDEQDRCQMVLAVGSACQFNRDGKCPPPFPHSVRWGLPRVWSAITETWRARERVDECEAPPNFNELADTTGFGLNFNGSVCLHNICMWANVTVGRPCVVQNTAYTAYGRRGEFIYMVSRGNCKVGLYCDTRQGVCVQTKPVGDTCDADKECSTFNCAADGKCGPTTDTLHNVGSWVYAVVGVYVVGGMIGIPVALYLVDKKHRAVEREKHLQYWREQNVTQMQETVQHSLVSYTLGGGSITSEDSGTTTMHGDPKGGGLWFYVSDDDSDDSDEYLKA
ncbi:hypothetical protein GSI_03671 [Ganoderma sinense ZZ0214-1]|uniref:Transporter n=1 Tax=Ganoderma sinense ZZ0214-1 TaxID=1077348 RepID=A0A2G8SJM3_9APHY|nr:hypothetical protein GSI_03671 [Ganoderma sinense ZZ0214-1]